MAATVTESRFESESYITNETGVQAIIIKNNMTENCTNPKQFNNGVALIEKTLTNKGFTILEKILDQGTEEISSRLDARIQSFKGGRVPDVLLVFIMGFGVEPTYFFAEEIRDGSKLLPRFMVKEHIVDKFLPTNCPELLLRPKLFFIQIDGEYLPRKTGDFLSAKSAEEEIGRIETVPTDIDLLMYTSGLPCNNSGENDSPFFMNFLCSEFKGARDKVDINDIIMNTNKKMSKQFYYQDESIPTCVNQLVKHLYL